LFINAQTALAHSTHNNPFSELSGTAPILYLIIQISMLWTDGFFDRTQQYGIGLVTFDTALSEKHFDGLTIFASCVALSTVNPQVKL
jgi:hypothetical protein